ncbi:hypothetical protein DOTSEDRAFT_125081 [Dothistroma septosporum NZE10]|uniref:Endonuclease/exonuclease/phosphatase domain-containing protein n=1 Tax=Dothistroma septosporum (strain NZE10 / CBS 128990) TaxID=675120 RepID=N1Q0V2_DOTSN|nr:hypothetical protein DOTSEDRAFT_125081 [Dothistroma septosporum NZE10]
MTAEKSITRGDISPPPSSRRRKLASPRSPQRVPECINPHRLTIYSWNINGIAPFVQKSITSFFRPNGAGNDTQSETSPASSLRDVLRRYEWPTMLFLQEVKINPDDSATQRAVERAVNPAANDDPRQPSYRAFFCLPSDKHNARGFGRKVYGVCSIIREDFFDKYVLCTRGVSWDAEGRFLVCETRPCGLLPKLAIFNVYAVNGTENPYKDPQTGEIVGTRHNRKLEVHQSLEIECRNLEADGVQVILAGDINIARSRLDGYPNLRTMPEQHCVNRADFESRFFAGIEETNQISHVSGTAGGAGVNMIDSWRHFNPRKAGYTYYGRARPFGSSCDRVDMILLSRELEARLVKAGIHETPADRGPSDHVPLYVELQTQLKDVLGRLESGKDIVGVGG